LKGQDAESATDMRYENRMPDRILAQTRYLRLKERDGWAFVDRPNAHGVVVIVPLTPERRLIFVEQHRPPIAGRAIEFPAGLMGDEPGQQHEDAVEAARRELEEETGYRAGSLKLVNTSATSPGMTDEMVRFVIAWDLVRVGAGGGVASENITVHEVPLTEARTWLEERERQGCVLAAKVFAGLYFAHEAWG
jgi:ADP-ribose pyrophosphatase